MILQNISKAIREQNYYAVALEFVIVIAGVVIGFQINGWAEDQRLREQERGFVERLYVDLEAVERRLVVQQGRYEEAIDQWFEIIEMLSLSSETGGMDRDKCQRIWYSHIIRFQLDAIPALEELAASGDRRFIQDQSLGAALSTFVLQQRRVAANLRGIEQRTVDLSPKYPDLLQRRIIGTEIRFDRGSSPDSVFREALADTCDLVGMRANQAFIGDFLRNAEAGIAIYEADIHFFGEYLGALKAALDEYRAEPAP